jgi:hypothetical protein
LASAKLLASAARRHASAMFVCGSMSLPFHRRALCGSGLSREHASANSAEAWHHIGSPLRQCHQPFITP